MMSSLASLAMYMPAGVHTQTVSICLYLATATDSTPATTDHSTTDSSTTVTPPNPPTPPTPTALSEATILAVVFSVVGGIVLLLVAVIVILLITILIVRRNWDPRYVRQCYE